MVLTMCSGHTVTNTKTKGERNDMAKKATAKNKYLGIAKPLTK